MAFCSECRQLLQIPIEEVVNQEHQRSSFLLSEAVRRGCPLCRIFQESLLHTCSVAQNITVREAEEYQIRIDQEEEEAGLDCFDFSYYTVTAVGPALSGGNDLKDGLFGLRYERYFGYSSPDRQTEHAIITACAVEDNEDDDVGFVNGRRITAKPDLNVVRKWIQACRTQHPHQCIENSAGWLPPRVIDVGITSSKIHLVETSRLRDSFIALSHRWGNQRPYTTTTLNYGLHLEHIDFEVLPKTFQDAIVITRDLGIRYLWIDCLCIKQDSVRDWAEQCVQMPTIYSKAALVLAGPQSPDPSSGLLHDRVLPEIPTLVIEWQTNKSIKPLKFKLLYQGLDYTMAGLWKSVLADRAWIYQERLLSQRILYLGRQMMYWECNTARYYEPAAHLQDAEIDRTRLQKTSFERIEGRQALLKYWYTLMMQYHRCKLTVPEDKLPALSGIARRFHDLLGDEYIAGLWRSDFVQGLCWQVSAVHGRGTLQEDSNDPEQTQSSFIAPSWSWASTQIPVEMKNIEPLDKDLEIIKVAVDLSTEDSFGRLLNGFLTVSGRLHAVTRVTLGYGITLERRSNIDENWKPRNHGKIFGHLRLDTGDRVSLRSHEHYETSTGSTIINTDDWPNFSDQESGNENPSAVKEMFLLNLGIEDREFPYWHALALEPKDESGFVFRRIGIASGNTREHWTPESQSGKWFRTTGEIRTVTIL